jgi:hypothetical protein
LKQWFCDRCGEVIEKPEDGWVHWRRDDESRIHSIEILHHLRASPRGGAQGCYPRDMDSDMHLDTMLGARGIVDLLSMIDVGKFHDPEGRHVGSVKDVRNWVEVFRRLHVPYYEEARRYLNEARANGDLEGINEVALYLPDFLESLVERYGDVEGDEDE